MFVINLGALNLLILIRIIKLNLFLHLNLLKFIKIIITYFYIIGLQILTNLIIIYNLHLLI